MISIAPRALAVGIFDGLGFIQNDGVPVCFPKPFLVEAKHSVACEHHVGVGIEIATVAVEHRDFELGTKLANLLCPVKEHTCGCDNEASAVKRTKHLQSFAKTHVIREHRPQSRDAPPRA